MVTPSYSHISVLSRGFLQIPVCLVVVIIRNFRAEIDRIKILKAGKRIKLFKIKVVRRKE